MQRCRLGLPWTGPAHRRYVPLRLPPYVRPPSNGVRQAATFATAQSTGENHARAMALSSSSFSASLLLCIPSHHSQPMSNLPLSLWRSRRLFLLASRLLLVALSAYMRVSIMESTHLLESFDEIMSRLYSFMSLAEKIYSAQHKTFLDV